MNATRKHLPIGRPRSPFSKHSRSSSFSLVTSQVGGLPLINEILARTKLEEFLEAYLPRSRREPLIPSSKVLLLLVRNLVVAREPMYGVGEWASRFAPDLLGLSFDPFRALNDDRVGRCLDQLFQADSSSLILATITHVVKEFQVELDELHNDSTTVTFCGRYEGGALKLPRFGKPTLGLTYGHNKDHRPDLKQLLFLLTVSQDGGVPVHFKAADGNLTDDRTHQETWKLLCQITGRKDFLYVADSKLATSENMTYIHERGGRFISVLPRTRREDREFRELLLQQRIDWKDVEIKGGVEGEPEDVIALANHKTLSAEGFRVLWFHSSQKQELDRWARQQKIEKSLLALSALREKLRSTRTRYRDRAKVEHSVQKILESHGTNRWVQVEIQQKEAAIFRQSHRGRPGKKTTYERRVQTRYDLGYEVETVKLAQDSVDDGVFPLITNDAALLELDVLHAYKRQPLVEKRFSQLKSDFHVAPVYLKSIVRIEALLCMYFFALLVQALLEREARRGMKAHRLQSLPLYPEQRKCDRPSTRRILDVLENIERTEIWERGKLKSRLVTELSSIQSKLLEILNFPEQGFGQPTHEKLRGEETRS